MLEKQPVSIASSEKLTGWAERGSRDSSSDPTKPLYAALDLGVVRFPCNIYLNRWLRFSGKWSFTYRMSFGFFQQINIESAFRNGPWLFPGTLHSCKCSSFMGNFDVSAEHKRCNLYQIAGKWVCLQYTFMHCWWCVSLRWSHLCRRTSIRVSQLLGSRIIEEYIISQPFYFLFFWVVAYFSTFMRELSRDEFWATSISCLLLYVYLWNWCWNRFRQNEKKGCVGVCVCLQWPVWRQVPITGSNSVCGGSSRRILSKLASLR